MALLLTGFAGTKVKTLTHDTTGAWLVLWG